MSRLLGQIFHNVHIAGLAGTLGIAASWYAWRVETRWLRLIRLRLPIPGLPPAFDGYRIVHLSDLHLGVELNHHQLPLIVATANREQPDMIAITGDFATGGRDGLIAGSAPLARLRAPDGVWGVPGNHDLVVGIERVAHMLDRAGIGLLTNRHHVLRREEATLTLAGVDDVVRGVPDLKAALCGAPHDAPVILLVHAPDYAPVAASDPRIALQLSGHTHGGQIRLPGNLPLVLPLGGRMYPAGLYRVGNLAVYVTTGTGTGRFVFRLNCRPEIAVITLVSAAATPESDSIR